MEAYFIYFLTLAAIFAIGTMAYNVSAGYTGLFTLAQAGLLGVGAYTYALLTINLHWTFVTALAAALVVPAIANGILAYASKKIRGDAFAILTLWFGFVVVTLFLNWRGATRGALGLNGIPRPEFLDDTFLFLLFAVLLTALSYIVLRRIVSSPFGRALGAVRDDEVAAVALGKDVTRLRVTSAVVNGVFAGLAGALLAMFLGYINPTLFDITLLVQFIGYMVVGGLGSLEGSILGTVLLLAVREAIRFVPLDPELVGAIREIIFASILGLVILYRPRGLIGKVELE